MMYAWQQTQWTQLWQANMAGRLPHALLLTGMAGIGKQVFAAAFSQALLCQTITAEQVACESCHMCRLVAGRAHPDVMWIEPEKEGGTIKVDQIRAVTDFINQTALQGAKRIVVIQPADSMNVNAANALLKTLEEPPAGSLIILVTSQPSRLLATVRSRCQHVVFQRPGRQEALSWLASTVVSRLEDADVPRLVRGIQRGKIGRANATALDSADKPRNVSNHELDWELLLNLANGAPLAAVQLANQERMEMRKSLFQALHSLSRKHADPLKSAADFSDIELIQLLDFMLGWIIDLLRVQIGSEEVVNKDYFAVLNELGQRVVYTNLLKFMQHLQNLRAQVALGLNLNKQLVIETLFIRWMETV